MHFESVAEKHGLSPLKFERSNKAYFELSIAPREKVVLFIGGVGYHISECFTFNSRKYRIKALSITVSTSNSRFKLID